MMLDAPHRMRLRHKVAVVTGAARGQGRSHAIRLAAEGADIVALDACVDVPTVTYPGPTMGELEETAVAVQRLGRRPTAEEMAEELGITAQKVQELRDLPSEPVSLEAPVGKEEDGRLGDFIEDEGSAAPEDGVEHSFLREDMLDALETLSWREKRVLLLRYGLEDGQERTLEQVGQAFGVTRERIRQLQNSALTKMRRALRKKEKPLPKPLSGGLAEA